MQILKKTELETIERLTKSWNIGDWDVLIVGDGSGQGWANGCGWASVLIDRHLDKKGGRKLLHGAWNLGTINLAELMPYYHALAWYADWRAKNAHPCSARGLTRVAIVSDCKALVEQGQKILNGDKAWEDVKANRGLWLALYDFVRLGYVLNFHWAARATSALNVYCDAVANSSRLAVSDTQLKAQQAATALNSVMLPHTKRKEPVSIYDCNPVQRDRTVRLEPSKIHKPRLDLD
jgi:ribonuclease HI